MGLTVNKGFSMDAKEFQYTIEAGGCYDVAVDLKDAITLGKYFCNISNVDSFRIRSIQTGNIMVFRKDIGSKPPRLSGYPWDTLKRGSKHQ